MLCLRVVVVDVVSVSGTRARQHTHTCNMCRVVSVFYVYTFVPSRPVVDLVCSRPCVSTIVRIVAHGHGRMHTQGQARQWLLID